MVDSFKNLEIWKKANALILEIYKATSIFPKEEQYSLTSQLRRSANSIAGNIAESQGRYYFADKIRVIYTARGELYEVRSYLNTAKDLKYIDLRTYEKLDFEYENLSKSISAYINYLQKNR